LEGVELLHPLFDAFGLVGLSTTNTPDDGRGEFSTRMMHFLILSRLDGMHTRRGRKVFCRSFEHFLRVSSVLENCHIPDQCNELLLNLLDNERSRNEAPSKSEKQAAQRRQK
jgi:hypothetical protein